MLADKVHAYAGENVTILDGAVGSGQLEQFINFKHLIGVDVQREALDALKDNYTNADGFCDSFFNYNLTSELPDIAVMNPPFSFKFKEFSKEEQANIQKDFPWKKSGVVDDVFVLKALKIVDRFGFFILFPGVGYRKTEKKFRELIGCNLVELCSVRNAFEDTSINVLLIVVDKDKRTDELKRFVYDMKSNQKLAEDTTALDTNEWQWEELRIEEVKEPININLVNQTLDEYMLHNFKRHLESYYIRMAFFDEKVPWKYFFKNIKTMIDEYSVKFEELAK